MGRSGTQHGELGPSDSSSSGQADLAIRSGTKLTIMRTVSVLDPGNKAEV